MRSGPIITGAVLTGAGLMLAVAGFVVGTGHIVAATRRWVRELEVPPGELAKVRWAQAKAAAAAGSEAWQKAPVNQRARAGV